MGLNPGEILIDESTPEEITHASIVDGQPRSRGLVPRDPILQPSGYLAGVPTMKAVNFPLIPRSEWSDRIKEMEATKSRLSDLRMIGNAGQMIPALDQDGVGYCWAHSSTGAVMMLRAKMGQPYVPLSAFAVASIIKQGRDEGGWGALSLQWIMENGVPSQALWPQQSRDLSHDTPAMRANAALHKVAAGWVDLEASVYDRKLSFDQMITLLLCRIPVVTDFNWWSHSVCAIDPVEIEPGSFGPRILNSWGDSWSDRGMGVLQGSKGVPDNAVAPTVTEASAA